MKKVLMQGVRLPAHRFFEGENGDDAVEFDLAKVLADPKHKQAIHDYAEREIVAPIKTKNSELLGKYTAYKLADIDGKEVYMDPEEAKAAIQFVKTEGKDVPTKIQNAVAEATQRATGQITDLTGKLTEKDQLIEQGVKARHQMMVGYELRDALRDSGIKPGKLPLHEMYLASMVRVEVADGVEQISVLDAKGQIRYGKNGPMTLSEFIEEYRDEDDIADDWLPDAQGGSGGGGGDPPTRRSDQISMDLDPVTRLKMQRQRDAQRKAANGGGRR